MKALIKSVLGDVWPFIVIIVVCAVALAHVGNAEERLYCNNVRDGVWPDYLHTYKRECGGKEPPQFHEDLTK